MGYKMFEALETKPEKIYDSLNGEYILANERALIIATKDSFTYNITFLPSSISEQPKLLNGYLTTLNNRKYLNVFTDDDNLLLFRIDRQSDSLAMKLVTHKIMDYSKGQTLKEYLKKDGNIPDTSSALFTIPSKRMKKGEGIEWSSKQLRGQVKDLESFYKYSKLFPEDKGLNELKEKAIEMTLSKTVSVARVCYIMQQYPEASTQGKIKAKALCTTTRNCLEYISCFPQEAVRDSAIDKAFFYSKNTEDYKILLEKFPDHKMAGNTVLKYYFEEKSRCKSAVDDSMLMVKFSANPVYQKIAYSARAFDNLPSNEIIFNTSSYILAKNSAKAIDRFMLYLSEVNREKQFIYDVYVVVNCKIVPDYVKDAGKINFRQSCNRIVAMKKVIGVNPPKNIRFHYIPSGQAGGADTVNQGSVKFILDEKTAEIYKTRFIKLALAWRKDYVIPSMDREYIGDVYVREPDLEMYVANAMAERLLVDKKAKFKIVPINFWKEEYGKDLPEFDEVRYTLLQVLQEKKLKKKNPGAYVYDAF